MEDVDKRLVNRWAEILKERAAQRCGFDEELDGVEAELYRDMQQQRVWPRDTEDPRHRWWKDDNWQRFFDTEYGRDVVSQLDASKASERSLGSPEVLPHLLVPTTLSATKLSELPTAFGGKDVWLEAAERELQADQTRIAARESHQPVLYSQRELQSLEEELQAIETELQGEMIRIGQEPRHRPTIGAIEAEIARVRGTSPLRLTDGICELPAQASGEPVSGSQV